MWPDTIKDPIYEDADTNIFKLNHPAHETYHYANRRSRPSATSSVLAGTRATDIVQTHARSDPRAEDRERDLHRSGRRCASWHTSSATFISRSTSATGFIAASGPPAFVQPNGPEGWRPTLGGNLLVYGPENRFNLHSYWDSHAVNITIDREDATAYAARLHREVKPAPSWTPSGDPDGWPAQWATEGLAHAKDAYKGIRLLADIGPDADEAKRAPVVDRATVRLRRARAAR